MESFFSRYKNPLVLALALLVQFALLAVQVQPRLPGAAAADQAGVKALRVGVASIVTPPEKVLHQSGLGVRGFWSRYVDLVDTEQQNEQLRADNQRLQLTEAALAEDAREGERLQELLAFKQHYIDTTVPAEVVGSSGSDHGHLLYLDKGSNDGLAPDMPVITPDGIVGRIRSVDPNTSQVLEINDPTSAAGALLEATRTRGIVRGDGVGRTEIVDLMPDGRIKPGDPVLTSGGDQIFPRGLPVGSVEAIVPDVDNAPLVNIVLKPAANLGRLEEVLVVTGTSPAMTAATRRELARSEGTAAELKAAAAAKTADAEEAALEAERASDILAQRLPSATNVTDADAPDAVPGSSPETADAAGAPLHPPEAIHNDQYTPGTEPAAADLTPGQRVAPEAEGVPSTDRANHAAAGPDGAALPSPSESSAFLAAHNAALAARPHAPASHVAAPSHTAASSAAPVRDNEVGIAAVAPARPATGAVRSTAGAAVPHTGTPARSSAATIHTLGTTPHAAPVRRSTAPSVTAPAAHRAVPTQIITDGPLPSAHGAKRPTAAAPTARRKGPAIVPDDGSRPSRAPRTAAPATNSAEPQ